jgi:glycosyltransferase involved in cell wall biosynthesis
MEEKLRNVIVVAYYWPPAGGPGVQRWVGLTRYFRANGLRPIVVIPKNAAYPQLDFTLEGEAEAELELIKVPIIEPIRWAKWLGFSQAKDYSKGLLPSKPKGLLQRLLFAIRAQFFVPDSRLLWIKPLRRVLAKLIEQHEVEAIITTGPPHSVHLAAVDLFKYHRSLTLKWIADFRDPWVEIGYHKTLGLTKRTLERHQKMEQAVVQTADLVLTTTQSLAHHYTQKYGAKTACVTNGFSYYYDDSSLKTTEDFNLLHVGSLFEHRNPVHLWRAIAELRAEGADGAHRIRLIFLGDVSEAVKDSLAENGLLSNACFEGYVPKQSLAGYVNGSSLLLLCEGDDRSYEFAVPGKLYEYLSMKAPLLAIGPKQWEVAQLVADLEDTLVVSHEQKDEMKLFIKALLDQFIASKLPLRALRSIERFEHQSLCQQLATHIKAL